ncbi:hypothetical protein Tco_0366953, partial [Tanacetum coccineum]
ARITLEGVLYPDTIRKGRINWCIHCYCSYVTIHRIVHPSLFILLFLGKKLLLMDEQAIRLLLKKQTDALHKHIAALAADL